jgi:hypothetical protein
MYIKLGVKGGNKTEFRYITDFRLHNEYANGLKSVKKKCNFWNRKWPKKDNYNARPQFQDEHGMLMIPRLGSV